VRVLLVEDDPSLARALRAALIDDGHRVVTRTDGDSGLLEATAGEYDVLVLDWMLPGRDGPTVCRTLRDRGVHTPVLMLTARGTVEDRVAGLNALADDYLVKPFALEELLARLRALGRRTDTMTTPTLRVGTLVLDTDRRTATRDGHDVPLTAREFDILTVLAQRAGRVVTRELLLELVWEAEPDLRSNVIDVHIATLRAKIDKAFGTSSIRTLRGVGYRLDYS
jgi:two-component system OmpR family response regulator